MKPVTIKILIDGERTDISLRLKLSPSKITTTIRNQERTVLGDNIFDCFVKLRKEYPDVKFLCKGAKINVFPSRMSSQMSGMTAYEMTLGCPALNKDKVDIFDYDDADIADNYEQQLNFYKSWIDSIRNRSKSVNPD